MIISGPQDSATPVSADMGGICVSRHKDPRSVPAAVQRPPWPLSGRPKSGRKCYITPAFWGGGQQRGQDQSTQKQQKAKIKIFHCVSHPTCKHGDCQSQEMNQRPSHHRGTVYPLGYRPPLTDVCTEMVLLFGPIWFSPIIGFF